MGRDSGPSREQAEVVALRALAWLVADEDLAGRFLAMTGCDGETLRQRAGLPEVLGSVLDFLLENEPVLLDFTQSADIAPDTIGRARRWLPGAMTEWQPAPPGKDANRLRTSLNHPTDNGHNAGRG